MMNKTVASVGIAAAASAGALLLTGSPASAQTTPVSARTVADAQEAQHQGDHRGHGRVHHWHHDGDYYGHHHHGWSRSWNRDHRDHDDIRIVIRDSDTAIAVRG